MTTNLEARLTNLTYRPCVGIVLFNKNNEVFVGRRNDVKRRSWQFPQGGINAGEDPAAAALRELEEETNIKTVKILKILGCLLFSILNGIYLIMF